MPSYSLRPVPRTGLRLWQAVERIFDTAFSPTLNPLRHLGTIGFLALWILVVSGIILYIFYDTSVEGAWLSIERLARWPLGTGHIVRGLHHYAADLLILIVLLHSLREWLHNHEHGARRFHWLTGVPLLGFCFISAIGGFWLVWDQLSQYSATSTAYLLDGLPLLASPLSRNFLSVSAVSDRLFSLFIFIHVGVPLLLIFGLWFHIQRLTHVALLPPRHLTISISLTLTILALARPVHSLAPARLDQVPAALNLDWILLWLHPLTDVTSRGITLILVVAVLLLLLMVPFLPRRPRPPVAVVDPAHCSGCRYCFVDCPYAAITMVPHPHHQHPGHWLAQVDANLCTGCGICTGACPSSTPFRSVTPLKTGIDMTQLPIDSLRAGLQSCLSSATTDRPVIVFSCRHSAPLSTEQTAGLNVFDVLCSGQLPPSFIDYALGRGAAGVVIASCAEGGCEFRLGERWAAQRLAQQRAPQLRPQTSTDGIRLVFAGPDHEKRLHDAIQQLQENVRKQQPETIANTNDIIH